MKIDLVMLPTKKHLKRKGKYMKNYDLNENILMRGDVRYNSKRKKITCCHKNEDLNDLIDELNSYYYSLNDDEITHDYNSKDTYNVVNFW